MDSSSSSQISFMERQMAIPASSGPTSSHSMTVGGVTMNHQMSQSTVWHTGGMMAQPQQNGSPPLFDSYKQPKVNGQCGDGHHQAYDGVHVSGSLCSAPPQQSRMFPAPGPYMHQQMAQVHEKKDHQHQQQQPQNGFMMGYQQVPIRTAVHHHNSHLAPLASCHSQQAPVHMERVIQGGPSATIAAAHVRSLVLNHYSTSPSGYGTSGPMPSYYASAQTNSGQFMEYGPQTHHHHHHGHHSGITAAAAAAVQYAQQHHRAATAAAAASSFRPAPHHHHHPHPKVMNAGQTQMYQQTYNQYQQQHQYMHHHHPAVVHSHQHHGSQSGVVHQQQRIVGVGMPMQLANNGGPQPMQQHSRLVPFTNRSNGQQVPLPQEPPHHAHHQHRHVSGYSMSSLETSVSNQQPMAQIIPQPRGPPSEYPQQSKETKGATAALSSRKPNQLSTKHPVKDTTTRSCSSEKAGKPKTPKTCKIRRKPPKIAVKQKKKSAEITNCGTKKSRTSVKPGGGSSSSNNGYSSPSWKVEESDNYLEGACDQVSECRKSNGLILSVVVNGSSSSSVEDGGTSSENREAGEVVTNGTFLNSDGCLEVVHTSKYRLSREDVMSYIDCHDCHNFSPRLSELPVCVVCKDCNYSYCGISDPQSNEQSDSEKELRLVDQCSQCPEDCTHLFDNEHCDCDQWSCADSHCDCGRINGLNSVKPPPGFEHLMRPSFPIESYDPSLLGNLMGAQLSHESVSILHVLQEGPGETAASGRCDGEGDEGLPNNSLGRSKACATGEHGNGCQSHVVENNNCKQGTEEESEEDDEWESLHKEIKNVMEDWREELELRKKVQRVLCRVNLNDVFVKRCLIPDSAMA